MITNTMPCIGRGAFSTAYRKTRSKVLIKSRDQVKECMALGWFPRTPLFPSITHVATSACGNWKFYEERYYPRVRGLKKNLTPFDWEFYKALKNLADSGRRDTNWSAKFEQLPSKFERRKLLLQEACNVLYNYNSNVHFEISPRNVAVHNSRLVLLDCFFIR